MLIPRLQVISTSSTSIQVIDATGDYDAISNPGGYGGPNPNRNQVIGVFLSLTPLNQPEVIPNRLGSSDQVDFLYSGGVSLTPLTGDGVYVVRSRIGVAASATLSTDPTNALHFLMTGAATVLAGCDSLSIDTSNPAVLYLLDQTQPPTSTDGYVTSGLPIVTAVTPTIYYPATSNALVYQAGYNCLMADIAHWAGTCDCCEGDELQQLLCRYGEYLAMLQKFNVDEDFSGADFLARKLQRDCISGLTPCYVQGPQPNVPFTGNGPVITQQPVSQSVSLGSEVVFGVQATGTAPLAYQWYKNGVAIPGQNGNQLMIASAQSSDAGSYYVIVTNAYGSIQSNTVSISVAGAGTPVSVTQQPTSQSGSLGGSVTFSVTAAGSTPLSYQWYKNGSPISGATGTSLTLSNLQPGDLSASYYVIVSNTINSVQSNTVAITQNVTVGWGWTSNAVPNSGDIAAAQGAGTMPTGSKLVADFRANTSPKVLFAFEPSSEPVKTLWYGDVNNNGAIGDPNNDLFISEIIGGNRVYYTVFPTQQTGEVIEFLTSSQTP